MQANNFISFLKDNLSCIEINVSFVAVAVEAITFIWLRSMLHIFPMPGKAFRKSSPLQIKQHSLQSVLTIFVHNVPRRL